MLTKKDYYETLGINRDADAAAIKKAYRKLAKKYHPDTNAGNARAEQMFKDVTEAYTILSDPDSKKLYDQFGHAAFDGSAPDSSAYDSPGGSYQEYHFEDGTMDDILSGLFGSRFHGGSSENFKYRGYRGSDFDFRRKGADLHSDVFISFDEAAFGCDKVIRLQEPNGSVRSLKIHVPAGIETGKSIRLRGKGMPGTNGGGDGDLLLLVTVGEKNGYERKGMDVYTTTAIPFTTAVFGGEVRVPTLYGDVMCKIQEGTQSGTKIRLRGKGIVSMKQPNVYGDQYVTVQIQVPKNLNHEARQKLKEYESVSQNKGQKRTGAA
ncbi:DnaJ domain-containing protein [Ruminococcus sp. OA3]|nr:DnaJ domain-containing protein [Ruminococcus sp. OA3]